ncbi:hypothetical protein BN1263130090 [Stenotrophomonas thermophila]|nr:hypothetical protein BN1263130090 [Stenotrophomonas maltophilia]
MWPEARTAAVPAVERASQHEGRHSDDGSDSCHPMTLTAATAKCDRGGTGWQRPRCWYRSWIRPPHRWPAAAVPPSVP